MKRISRSDRFRLSVVIANQNGPFSGALLHLVSAGEKKTHRSRQVWQSRFAFSLNQSMETFADEIEEAMAHTARQR